MTRQLVLASKSPRRRLLLEEAGFAPVCCPPAIDDGELVAPGAGSALEWVAALAYLKAAAGRRELGDETRGRAVVLGSDTVVIKGDRIIGQPADAASARETIELLAGGSHAVASGVALLMPGGERRLFVDVAPVALGPLTPGQVTEYLQTESWRGKAGGYNFSERVADGWPLSTAGDPTTIMGLPMRILPRVLHGLGIRV